MRERVDQSDPRNPHPSANICGGNHVCACSGGVEVDRDWHDCHDVWVQCDRTEHSLLHLAHDQ